MSVFFTLAVLIVLLHGGVSINVRYRYGEEAERVEASDGTGRISGVRDRQNKDFVFGGLFHVHSEDASASGGRCGGIRDDQDLEAMLFAMDYLNSDDSVLRGLEIGYDVRDTCTSENVGLDETIDLILTGNDFSAESCEMSANTTTVPTLGIVGAAASRVSIPVASLGRLFTKPQISYASSSPLLSNRDRYTFFFRTIPPDTLQARAIIDLLLYFNWTHISTIYSRDQYGQPGTDELKLLARQQGMCIDLDEALENHFVLKDYQALANRLVNSDARVVVLFTHEQNVDLLLTAMKAENSTEKHRFIWIGVDAWAQSTTLLRSHSKLVAGFYGLAPLAPIVDEFDRYFSKLTIDSNQRNPWFDKMFASYGECSLNESSANPCRRNVSHMGLPREYVQSNLVALTTDAVYAFAHALQNFLTRNCENPIRWDRITQTCAGQKNELTGSALLGYIRNVSFASPTGNWVRFNENGSVEGKYDILSYFVSDDPRKGRTYSLRNIGSWIESRNESLLWNITETDLQFGIDENDNIRYEPPSSQCGKCRPGEYRREVVSSCCGDCAPCLGQNFSNASLSPSCTNCSIFGDMWGNDPLRGSNGCVPIEERFLEFSHPWAIIIVLIAIIGLICVTATAIIFGIYWNTKIVKASGREQMIMLMVGIVLSFLQVFIYLAPPVLGICVIQRISIWFCFSLMFGAILVKIIRVARIFMNQGKVTHVRFTEPYYQVLFTVLVVLGQLVFVVASIGSHIPQVERPLRKNGNDFPEIIITCRTDELVFLLLSVIYESVIIITSTILGVMSFKYPANFNEAKYISFCTFALLVIWLGFIPSYIATQQTQEFQNAVISMATIMSAFAVLVCIFGPKLFIILFRSKLNKGDPSSYAGTFPSTLTTTELGSPSQKGTHTHTVASVQQSLS